MGSAGSDEPPFGVVLFGSDEADAALDSFVRALKGLPEDVAVKEAAEFLRSYLKKVGRAAYNDLDATAVILLSSVASLFSAMVDDISIEPPRTGDPSAAAELSSALKTIDEFPSPFDLAVGFAAAARAAVRLLSLAHGASSPEARERAREAISRTRDAAMAVMAVMARLTSQQPPSGGGGPAEGQGNAQPPPEAGG